MSMPSVTIPFTNCLLLLSDAKAHGQGMGTRTGAPGEGEDWPGEPTSGAKAGNGAPVGQGSVVGVALRGGTYPAIDSDVGERSR